MTLSEAVNAAKLADDKWVATAELMGLTRWAKGSHGAPGTILRKAYDAKWAADIVMQRAFEADRAAASIQRAADAVQS